MLHLIIQDEPLCKTIELVVKIDLNAVRVFTRVFERTKTERQRSKYGS